LTRRPAGRVDRLPVGGRRLRRWRALPFIVFQVLEYGDSDNRDDCQYRLFAGWSVLHKQSISIVDRNFVAPALAFAGLNNTG
jgi:hypothetical protein